MHWRRRASVLGSETSDVVADDDDRRSDVVSTLDEDDDDESSLDDVAYYRKRSELLQRILDKKQDDDSLARDKLKVLQDVVQRQSQRLKEEWQSRYQQQQQQQQQSATNETADASRQQADDEAAAAARALYEQVNAAQLLTIEELRANMTRAEDAAERLQSRLDKAEHSLAKRKGEMQHQQLYYQSQIDELRRTVDDAQREAERSREALRSQRLHVDQAKQQHALDLETKLAQAEERFNTSLQVARSKFEIKLKEAHDKLKESENQVRVLQERDDTHRRQISEWEEKLLIASASVQASEQREQELVATIQQLRSVAAVRNDTIRHLQAKVVELRTQLDTMERDQKNASTAAILPSTALQDAATIKDLEEQIRNLKHAQAAQLRSQRRQFEQELDELREQMLVELRDKAAVEHPIRTVTTANPAPSRSSSPSGAARRLWQRVKRPFQRR